MIIFILSRIENDIAIPVLEWNEGERKLLTKLTKNDDFVYIGFGSTKHNFYITSKWKIYVIDAKNLWFFDRFSMDKEGQQNERNTEQREKWNKQNRTIKIHQNNCVEESMYANILA